MNTSDEIKAALAEALAQQTPDLARIQQLSEQFLNSSPGLTRFSVDAGLVARLGRELVARQETALSELVKNAYDADATEVSVHIARAGYGNFIEIVDNGSGMSRAALVDGFMRLATDSKLQQPISPIFSRPRAGKKGVGRFAAERLGRMLTLVTGTADADEALQIEVEWSRFSSGADLGAIFIPVTNVPKPFEHGTRLHVAGLRDAWTPAAVERSFKHVLDLIDPGNQVGGPGEGSDFDVRFRLDGNVHRITDIRAQVLTHAFATIEAKVDGEGNVTWSLSCPKLRLARDSEPLRMGPQESSVAEHARNASLKVHYFILGTQGMIPPTARSTVQEYLARHGGITLYRQGFRVPPYGQAGNDWLDLDKIAAARTQTLAPIRSRNFLGSVSINDDAGLYEETSSREGIIETPAFEELRTIARSAVLTAVREIDAERHARQLKISQITVTPSPAPSAAKDAASSQSGPELGAALLKAVEKAEQAATRTPETRKVVERLRPLVEEVARRAADRDALLREIDMLRVLASMGLAVGQFTHEFSTLSGAMKASLAILMEDGRSNEERTQAAATVAQLLDQTRAFSGLFRSMTEDNSFREREQHDLYELVTSFRKSLGSILARNGVSMEVVDQGEEVLTPTMHRSEVFAILLNFTTNSIKAIKRAGRAGKILVELSSTKEGSVLKFMDNGDGVAPSIKERMFDAFVTTTAAPGSAQGDDELASGSGLGLAIVKDIVTAAGGTVDLVEPAPDFATCMQLVLPESVTAQ